MKYAIGLYEAMVFKQAVLTAEILLLKSSTVEELCTHIDISGFCNNDTARVIVKQEGDHYNLYAAVRYAGAIYVRRIVQFDKNMCFDLVYMVAGNVLKSYFNIVPDPINEDTYSPLDEYCRKLEVQLIERAKLIEDIETIAEEGTYLTDVSSIIETCKNLMKYPDKYRAFTPYNKIIVIKDKKFYKED